MQSDGQFGQVTVVSRASDITNQLLGEEKTIYDSNYYTSKRLAMDDR